MASIHAEHVAMLNRDVPDSERPRACDDNSPRCLGGPDAEGDALIARRDNRVAATDARLTNTIAAIYAHDQTVGYWLQIARLMGGIEHLGAIFQMGSPLCAAQSEPVITARFTCTREHGHDGPHVAHTSYHDATKTMRRAVHVWSD